jgi:CTP:molybdopterin cytidylyltransferase MocA
MAEFSGFASWRDGAATPAASAALAAAALPPERAFLLTSADHPLLSVAMIEALCDHPAARDHDIVAGLVRHAAVRARYPDARCTALRFADDHYCGTNLYLFRTARARRVITAWQSVEAARKSPWRVIRILGPVAVLAYVTGRLSLPRALAILSRRFGVAAAAALLDDPRAALDVDTAADWQFACRLLAEPGAVQS